MFPLVIPEGMTACVRYSNMSKTMRNGTVGSNMGEEDFERRARHSHRMRNTVLSAVGVVTMLGVQNAELIYDSAVALQDDKNVPLPPGCEVKDASFDSSKQALGETDVETEPDRILEAVGGGGSAARSVPLRGSSAFDTRSLHIGYFDTPIGEVYEASSGITYSIKSDAPGGFTIDEAALEEAATVALKQHEVYAHPAVRTVMECLYRDILVDRKLDGEKIDLFIPSRPNVCMFGAFMVRLNETQTTRDCHTNGFTMPAFTARFGLLEYHQKGYVVVTGGSNDPENAEQRVARLLVHELLHEYLRKLGVVQRIDPEERFVDYVMLTLGDLGLYQKLRPVTFS